MGRIDWEQEWKAGHTPWDAGASPPALRVLLDRDLVPAGRILVPGCGTGYDLATLARPDREVVGIDLSEEARASFQAAHPELSGRVIYEVADFLSYDPSAGFDFVWDYTFFCALDPDQRPGWSRAMTRLLKPSAILAALLFPYEDPVSTRQGPPWPINADLMRDHLGDAFEELDVAEVEHSHPGRQGRERLALWRRRAD